MLSQSQIVAILSIVLILSLTGLSITATLEFLASSEDESLYTTNGSNLEPLALKCCPKLSVHGLSTPLKSHDGLILEQVPQLHPNLDLGPMKLPIYCQDLQIGRRFLEIIKKNSYPFKEECKKGCWLIGIYNIPSNKILVGTYWHYQVPDSRLSCPDDKKQFSNFGKSDKAKVIVKCTE